MIAAPMTSVPVRTLVEATTAIRHRGPDDEGYVLLDPVARKAVVGAGRDTDFRLGLPPMQQQSGGHFSIGLGHRRLSILDVSPAGHQPMSTRDDMCWIIFNGEIYNFIELRKELVALGATFHSDCDTEVLLAAYRAWGDAMLPRLVGMFSFAIVDLVQNRVLLARDPFGIKPLYFAMTPAGFVFASEIKALLAFPFVSREADPAELHRYLRFGWTDATDATMFAHIRQLPVAHSVSFPLDAPGARAALPYWEPEKIRPVDLSLDEAADELRSRLRESVRLHLRSDVPLGACLSGGLDSSVIVRLMRDELGPAGDLHVFSFITDDPRLSELPYVKIMANEINAQSHLVHPAPEDLAGDFDELVVAHDQPFSGSSIYAQYRVFKLAREAGMKVMLDGQGSDELLGGYPTAISARIAALLSAGQIIEASKLWRAGDFVMMGTRARIALSALGRMLPANLAAKVMPLVGESLMPSWASAEYFHRRGVFPQPRPQGRARNALREELLLFTKSVSLPQLLRYEDRNSMHFSIESRVPFCNTAVAELAFSLGAHHLVTTAGTTKAVLRRAVDGIVPKSILDRAKVGFSTPEQSWLAHMRPWVTAQLESDYAAGVPFLNQNMLPSVMLGNDAAGAAFRPALWRVLNVLRWGQLLNVQFS